MLRGLADIYNDWDNLKRYLRMFSSNFNWEQSFAPQKVVSNFISLVKSERLNFEVSGFKEAAEFLRLYRRSIDQNNYLYILVTPRCLDLCFNFSRKYLLLWNSTESVWASGISREGLDFRFFVMKHCWTPIGLGNRDENLKEFISAASFPSRLSSDTIDEFCERNYLRPAEKVFIQSLQSETNSVKQLHILKVTNDNIEKQIGSVWDRYALIMRILRDFIDRDELKRQNIAKDEVIELENLVYDWATGRKYKIKNTNDCVITLGLLDRLIYACKNPVNSVVESWQIRQELFRMPQTIKLRLRLDDDQIGIPNKLVMSVIDHLAIEKPSDLALYQQKLRQVACWLENWKNEDEAWIKMNSALNSRIISATHRQK